MAIVLNPEHLTLGFGLGLPAATYLYLFWVTRPRWIRSAPRPQQGEEPTLPQNVRPALAGLFMDGKVGEPEIAATIVDLLQQGFLGIVDKGERIVLIKQKQLDGLPPFEKTIAEHLLAKGTIVKSELEIEQRINRKLYDEHLSAALRSLYQEGVTRGFFAEDPNNRYAWYYLTGLIIFFLGLTSFGLLLRSFGDQPILLFYPLGLLLTGTTVVTRARSLTKLTPGGRLMQEVWHDYRQELIHFKPKESRNAYLQYLPYAFALGVEEMWTNRWKDTVFERPEWFTSFGIPTREDFLQKLRTMVGALARDLYATRDPALKD